MSTQNQQEISRAAAVKMAREIAANNPTYKVTSNEWWIGVTDMDHAHVSGHRFFTVFCVRSSGRRTKAQIAAGEPIRYWIEKPETHWKADA